MMLKQCSSFTIKNERRQPVIGHIKQELLKYHQKRGFVLYDTFPLISKDPSVLFVNATITPFKHLFDGCENPHNYALVQQCLRVGGGVGELETARLNPSYSSLFDMFGSGLFRCEHKEAVEYFINMLSSVGLSKENLRFVVPAASNHFSEALLAMGVADSSIFPIVENGEFWHEWRFGKNGLVGSGITAVFAHGGKKAKSVDEMLAAHESFVEIGNLIHVYGKDNNGEVAPIQHKNFEVGLGVARLAIIFESKTLYELSPFNELLTIVESQMSALIKKNFDQGTLRVIVDHLRAIDALVLEGLRPGNKQHAFVLRKLIRSMLEIVWVTVEKIVSPTGLVMAFSNSDMPCIASLVADVVREEECIFRRVIERGRKFLTKDPTLDPVTLRDTYGIRQSLIPLIQE